jgi:O-antigen ligase
VAAVIIVIALATMVISFNQIALVLESRAGKGIREDVAERLELWSRAVNGIEDFPMTGMGMNTFRRVMPVVYPTSTSSPDLDVAHAHNALLQAALDVGLPGLVAYLAIWFGIAHLLWRVHRDGGPRDRLLAGGLGAGMLAYFLFGTADTIALGAKLGIFFWVALALITSMYQTREAKP